MCVDVYMDSINGLISWWTFVFVHCTHLRMFSFSLMINQYSILFFLFSYFKRRWYCTCRRSYSIRTWRKIIRFKTWWFQSSTIVSLFACSSTRILSTDHVSYTWVLYMLCFQCQNLSIFSSYRLLRSRVILVSEWHGNEKKRTLHVQFFAWEKKKTFIGFCMLCFCRFSSFTLKPAVDM